MLILTIQEVLEQISDFGNDIFSKTVGFIGNLPGVAAGIASLLLLALAAIGLLSLLKKSFKLFGIIILVLVAIVVAVSVFGQ